MQASTLPLLKIDDIVARVPIIQGGMSVGISLANLAAAVAEEGGIGVIGAAGLGLLRPGISPDFKESNHLALKEEIRQAREKTDGIIGVNIMMALTDHDSLINAAIDAGVDIIFVGAGALLKVPDSIDMERLKASKTKIAPVVSSAKGVRVMFNFWSRMYNTIPDAVVVEGPKAGGHLGFSLENIDDSDYSLEKILAEVIEEVKPFREKHGKDIPVIAAGGIYTGEDIYEIIKLGASGVQLGTRFVATEECDASDKFKQAYIDSKKEDITIIKSPVGMPGRAIGNEFLDGVREGIKTPFVCPFKCLRTCDYTLSPYCIAIALLNARNGRLDKG
ncbi:MAG TPA: nitronate monooxygenase, partial [Euryarchaeota archaeon]|nr:nitronate monooxygenase [Euryarchaeota archaeon]